MSQSDRAIKKLATQLARLDREVKSWRGAQLDYTSVENGGRVVFNNNDGSAASIVGGQTDGGNTVNVLTGPTPPTPTNFTVTVDHGSLTVHWDGDFEGGALAPTDWARWTAYAQAGQSVVPDRSTSIGGTDSASGGEVTAGVLKGEWTVTLLAWSQAGKPSAMAEPVTVDVPGYGDIVLTEIDAAETVIKNAGEVLVTEQDTLNDKLSDAFGQIEDAVASANGKNVVHYEDAPPTVDDPGVEGDTWFVGEFGRTEQLLATNLARNPSFTSMLNQIGAGDMSPSSGTAAIVTADWAEHGTTAVKITPISSNNTTVIDGMLRENPETAAQAGKTITISANIHLDEPQTGTLWNHHRRIVVRSRYGGFTSASYAYSENAPNTVGTHRVSVTFTLQPNTEWWYFMLTNGSSTVPVYWDSLMIEEGAGSGAYFDGDTADGVTDDDPHYRWTGEPHASTSEKYLPAILASGSDAWQIVEQYKFTGGEWVQVELNHQVISSMDVGKLVAGSAAIKEAVVQKLWAEVVVTKMAVAEQFIGENAILTGAVTAPKITASEELWAKIAQFVQIRAEHIEADAIDGMVITGPNIRTSATGARVQMDPNGVRVFNADDDVRTHLSPDGSTFKGEVEADTLVVNDGAEFKGNNTLAQGANLTLAAGVTDPTAPPIVQPFWDGLEFDPVFMNASDPVGLAWDGTNYITVGENKGNSGVSSFYRGVYAMKINGTTGASSQFRCDFSAASDSESRVSEVFGVTCIGSELFWLGRYGYVGYVWVTDLDGVFKRRFASPDIGYSATNPLTYRPGIGNDGTNLVTAQCTDAGSLGWAFISKTDGSVLAGGLDRGDATKSDITGVYVGNGDLGTKYVVVAKKSTNTIQVFGTNGSATDYSWYTDNGDVGIVFQGGKFHTLNSSGIVHEYTDTNTGDNSGDWWATYYWYTDVDDDNVIEPSDYQSRIAPPKRFTWPRRASLKIMGQPMPTGVESLGPALAKKSTPPVRTDFSRPGWQVDAGKPSARYVTLPANWQAFTSPSATNTFPEAEPSALESASGTFQVKGDGSGHWGPITWHADGTVTGPESSGQTVITPSAANTVTSVEVTFPVGRFKKAPEVSLTSYTTSPNQVSVGAWPISKDSFTLNVYSTTTAARRVGWQATDSQEA